MHSPIIRSRPTAAFHFLIQPAALLFLSLLLAGRGISAPAEPSPSPSPALPAPPPGVTVVHDVAIGLGGGRSIHAEIVYPEKKPSGSMPAIVFVHGGGWMGGKSVECLRGACFLAQHGYFVVCPEYRLSKEAKWPAQLEDCKLAVRWVRANAVQYDVNPDRIGCLGGSAGGHLVACLGTMNDPKFEGAGGNPGVSSQVQAVCDVSGPSDFTKGAFGEESDAVSPKQKLSDAAILRILLGAPFAQAPELWATASPVTWVKAGNPPFLVVHGDTDQVVSTAQGIKMFEALKKAGVPAQLILVKNGGHIVAWNVEAMGGSAPSQTPGTVELMNMILAFFDQNLKKS